MNSFPTPFVPIYFTLPGWLAGDLSAVSLTLLSVWQWLYLLLVLLCVHVPKLDTTQVQLPLLKEEDDLNEMAHLNPNYESMDTST